MWWGREDAEAGGQQFFVGPPKEAVAGARLTAKQRPQFGGTALALAPAHECRGLLRAIRRS